MKNGGRLIYYITQYEHFFTCSLDFYICESLKIAWLINQAKFTSTFNIFVLVALYLIKSFGTQSFLTKFGLGLRNFKLCKNASFCQGFWFVSYYPPDFQYVTFLDFELWFIQRLSFSFQCKSQVFLQILPAVVCIKRQPPCKNDCVIFKSVNRPVNSTYKANVFNKILTFLTIFSVNVNIAVDTSMNSNTIVCGIILSGKYLYHSEISQMIYSADQLDSLCMVQIF